VVVKVVGPGVTGDELLLVTGEVAAVSVTELATPDDELLLAVGEIVAANVAGLVALDDELLDIKLWAVVVEVVELTLASSS
jgi:hypothetical protein